MHLDRGRIYNLVDCKGDDDRQPDLINEKIHCDYYLRGLQTLQKY